MVKRRDVAHRDRVRPQRIGRLAPQDLVAREVGLGVDVPHQRRVVGQLRRVDLGVLGRRRRPRQVGERRAVDPRHTRGVGEVDELEPVAELLAVLHAHVLVLVGEVLRRLGEARRRAARVRHRPWGPTSSSASTSARPARRRSPSTPTARALGRGETAYPLLEPEPGQAVQDPAVVVDGTLAAIRAAAAARARPRRARSPALVVQRRDARPRRPRRRRPAAHAAGDVGRHARRPSRPSACAREHPELHDRTGTPLHPMSPLAKLRVVRRARARRPSPRARRWAGIKELVLRRLTGDVGRRPLGRVGHRPAQPRATLDWDAEALALAGIDADAAARRSCPTTQRLALGAAARGRARARRRRAGRRRRRRRAAGQPRPRRGAPRRGGLLDRHERRAAGHGRAPGGRPAAARLLLRADAGALGRRRRDQQRRRRAALGRRRARARPRRRTPRRSCSSSPRARRPGSDGLLMLPYLLSERAPHWSSLPRGAYVGLTRAHRREHLVRAALEGVCLQLALVLASMRDAGNEVARDPRHGRLRAQRRSGARCWPTRSACRSASRRPRGLRLRRRAARDGGARARRRASTSPPTSSASRTSSSPSRPPRPSTPTCCPTFAALYDALAPPSRPGGPVLTVRSAAPTRTAPEGCL